jgi:hypothetical protein
MKAAASAADPDATIYLEAVAAAGGTVTPTITSATNALFTDLKGASLYTKIDVMYPHLGGVAASNALNAKNVAGAFNITWYGGMTFSSNGAIGNGTNGYGDTNFNARTESDPLNYSWGCYVYAPGNWDQETYIFGAYDGSYITNMRVDVAPQIGLFGYSIAEDRNGITVPELEGMYIATFDSSKNKTIYYNYNGGSPLSSTAFGGADAQLQNQNTYTHVLNLLGSPYAGQYCTGTISFLYFGESLTSGEVATLSGIINNFQTALGRNTY